MHHVSCLQRGAFVSEPAILVRRKHRASQVWSMEKFENKIIDMRDSYHDWKERGSDVTHTQHTVDATRTRTGEHVIVVRRGVVLVRLRFAYSLPLPMTSRYSFRKCDFLSYLQYVTSFAEFCKFVQFLFYF